MKSLGYASVPVAQLHLPGNWPQIMNEPSIPAQAMSQQMVGVLNPPMVRKSDWQVVHGLHRIAAEVHNGKDAVHCQLVECDDAELVLARDIENAYRQHFSPSKAIELIDRVTKEVALYRANGGKPAINDERQERRKKGRVKLDRTVAREIVAEMTGKTVEAVRKGEVREKARRKEKQEAYDPMADRGIRSLGLDLDEEFRAKVNRVVKHQGEVSSLISRAIGRLTEMLGEDLPLHRPKLARLQQDLGILSTLSRGLIPVSLCPFCKGVPSLAKNCGGCMGSEYITANQEQQVAKELWNEEAPIVLDGGKFVPLDEYFDPPDAVEDSRAEPIVEIDHHDIDEGDEPDPNDEDW